MLRRLLPQAHRVIKAGDTTTARCLHVCTACSEPFVVLTGALAVRPTSPEYTVELSCNNCGLVVVADAKDDEMIALDLHTNFAQRAIERAVELLDRDSMREDVELLTQAIRSGHLLPEDF